MEQTVISCTDRKLPGSLPELQLTHPLNHVKNVSDNKSCGCLRRYALGTFTMLTSCKNLV
jgi:hypothetical protein